MTDRDTPHGDSTKREPPSSEALAQAIDTQRQQLVQIRALVDSQAKLLHQLYNFDPGEADLGHCCDAVRGLLNQVISALEPLSVVPDAASSPADPMSLAHMIEVPRQALFRAQAVAQAVENLLRLHDFEEGEPDLRAVLEMIAQTMDDVLEAIEPLTLGLPVPMP